MFMSGADINIQNKHGYIGYLEIVQLLVDNNADINIRNYYGSTALSYGNYLK